MTPEEKQAILERAGYVFRVQANPQRELNNFRTPDDFYWYADYDSEEYESINFEELQLGQLFDKAWQHYQKAQRTQLLERIIYQCTSLSDFLRDGFSEELYNEIVAQFEDEVLDE